jgi:hypothetical protein
MSVEEAKIGAHTKSVDYSEIQLIKGPKGEALKIEGMEEKESVARIQKGRTFRLRTAPRKKR